MEEEELTRNPFDFPVFPSFDHRGGESSPVAGRPVNVAPRTGTSAQHRLTRRGSIRHLDSDVQRMLNAAAAGSSLSGPSGSTTAASVQLVTQQLFHLQHQVSKILALLESTSAAVQCNTNNSFDGPTGHPPVTASSHNHSTLSNHVVSMGARARTVYRPLGQVGNNGGSSASVGTGKDKTNRTSAKQALSPDPIETIRISPGAPPAGGTQDSPQESSLPFTKFNPPLVASDDMRNVKEAASGSLDDDNNLDDTRAKMRTVPQFHRHESSVGSNSLRPFAATPTAPGPSSNFRGGEENLVSRMDDGPAAMMRSENIAVCTSGPKHDYSKTVDAEDRSILLLDSLYIFCTFLCSIVVVNMLQDRQQASLPAAQYIAILCVSQIVFGIWMVSRSRLRFTVNEWTIVDDLQQIRKNYVRTWLLPDLFLTLPIEFIFLGWANVVFRYFCVRHFLRWARLMFMNATSNPLASPRPFFSFLFVVGFFCLMAHTFAMIYRSINADSSEDGDIDYIHAIYFIVGTISSVGYQDFNPAGNNVRVFLVIVMGLGFCFLSAMTALATRFLAREDQVSAQMKSRKMTMHSMMQHYDIPWELQREVVSVFPSVLHNENEANFKNLIAALPTIVSRKVERFLRTRLLKQMTIFRDLSTKCGSAGEAALFDLAEVLELKYYPAMVNVLELSDDAVEETFFVLHGVLQVVVWALPSNSTTSPTGQDVETVLESLGSGGVYTQAAGVAECGGGIFTASACQLLVAGSDSLRLVLRRHKILNGILRAEAERQHQALAPFVFAK